MPQPADAQAATRYDAATIWFHWLTAALVLLLWCLGQTIDWFPRGDARVDARSVHIVIGAALTLLVCWRIVWRLMRGRRLPAAERGGAHVLSTLLHVALYVFVIGTLALGLTNAWLRGDNLFNLWRIPALEAERALRHQVGDLHGQFADILLILAALHALAGLWHFFIAKDRVMARMGIG